MKKNIPNILTGLRIALTPIIIVFGLNNNLKVVIILTIIASLTDMLDGFLARKWNVISTFGAKLDTVADKFFAISLVICLMKKNSLLIPVFILGILISVINLFYYIKYNNVKSLFIGKVKTTFLFITLILAFLTNIYENINLFVNILIIATLVLQVITIIKYLLYNKLEVNLEFEKSY